MAHIAVVGAGVIGCASAWALTRAGHRVTLVEQGSSLCGGASARNGAQLSYSYADALASPGLLAHLPSILLRRDPAFRVWLSPDPAFLFWGLQFLRNTTPTRFRKNTLALLQMAARTQALLPALIETYDLKFDYQSSGKMILYPDAAGFDFAIENSRFKADIGITQHVLGKEEAIRIEPALAHYRDHIKGVIYSPDDAAGRPTAFCDGLIDGLQRDGGLDVLLRSKVSGLMIKNGKVTGLAFQNRTPLEADAVVLATGHARIAGGTPRTVWPVQGYSVTVPARPNAMKVSITDLKRKLVFARLGEQVRIAGIADIAQRDFTFRPDRFDALVQGAQNAFSDGLDLGAASEAWSDARPCTPSSRPIIGHGKLRNLYLNLGHGTLGWTLCLGAAEQLAACVGKSLR